MTPASNLTDGRQGGEREIPEEEHEWETISGKHVACKKCGMIRRLDGKYKPCKGKVKVAMRDDPIPPEVSLEKRIEELDKRIDQIEEEIRLLNRRCYNNGIYE